MVIVLLIKGNKAIFSSNTVDICGQDQMMFDYITSERMINGEGHDQKMRNKLMVTDVKTDRSWHVVIHSSSPGVVELEVISSGHGGTCHLWKLMVDGSMRGMAQSWRSPENWCLTSSGRQMSYCFSLQPYNFPLPTVSRSSENLLCKSWCWNDSFWEVPLRTIQLFCRCSSGRIYTILSLLRYFHGLFFAQYTIPCFGTRVWSKAFSPSSACALQCPHENLSKCCQLTDLWFTALCNAQLRTPEFPQQHFQNIPIALRML